MDSELICGLQSCVPGSHGHGQSPQPGRCRAKTTQASASQPQGMLLDCRPQRLCLHLALPHSEGEWVVTFRTTSLE